MRKKSYGNLIIACKEMRINWKVLLICLLITSGLTTITLSLCSVIFFLPDSFANSIKNIGADIIVNDYSIHEVDKLSIPHANIIVNNDDYLNNFYIERGNQQTFNITDNRKALALYFDKYDNITNQYKGMNVDSGSLWHYSDNVKNNGRYSIWISREFSNNKIYAGEILKYYRDSSDEFEELEVMGIYSKPIDLFPDIIFPVGFLSDKIAEDDHSSVIRVYITKGNVYEVMKSYIFMNLNIDESNGLYSQIQGVLYMLALLWSVFLLMVFISVFIIYNLISMILIYREKFIGLTKALGETDERVINIYTIIVQILIILSILLSIFGAIRLNDFITETFRHNLELELDLKILISFPLFVYATFNLIFIIFRIFLKIRIRRIVAIDMVREEN